MVYVVIFAATYLVSIGGFLWPVAGAPVRYHSSVSMVATLAALGCLFDWIAMFIHWTDDETRGTLGHVAIGGIIVWLIVFIIAELRPRRQGPPSGH